MPVITIELAQGQANEDQKQQLIERLTTEAVGITGIPVDKFTTFIAEYPAENIGIGGRSLKALRAGR
jgi:4-oxalocrotonate tautomerase family enzyme